MIPISPAPLETETWQAALADAFRSPTQLLRHLGLADDPIALSLTEDQQFPVRVPRYFVDLMRPGDPTDPLLRQVLSTQAENEVTGRFNTDPVGDLAALRGHGLLQKYRGRALLITTGACAIHCRYCFRRHFPYDEQSPRMRWDSVAAALTEMPDVDELILSGGDPLMLSDRRLGELLASLQGVRSLRRLRIHTRLPVVLPNRITTDLVEIFAAQRLPVVWVIHANHPNELSPALQQALALLRVSGGTLLNQSVLLKSVNDDADTLVTLSKRLFDLGVLPYYLHLLDAVAGAAHFDVAEVEAQALIRAIRGRLPGYLVPRLVCEIAHEPSKRPVGDG